MQEILFRGKKANTEEWIKGGILPLDTDSGYVFIVEPYLSASTLPVHEIVKNHMHLVLPETVGQYTGASDRSGKKKIFEGDICRFYDDDGEISLYVVIWEGFSWKVKEVCLDRMDDLDEFFCKRCEVVGNVFDNPELLEEQVK